MKLTFTHVLLISTLLGLISVGHTVARLEESLKDTKLEARTASTLVQYWLPPLSGDRISCRRCHR